MKSDLHNHTIYSDGKNTAEEMILQAIIQGLDRFGISDHSYTFFDESYCMKLEQYDEYSALLHRLKEKYKGRIEFLCGVECDLFSDQIPANLDYVIGSVHYLKVNDEYLVLDWDSDKLQMIAGKYFHHDYYALCEAYYETVSELYKRTHCDIVGHFDLITKFNEGNRFFDENSERYRNAWKKAMLRLIPDVSCFEINYGARNKGLRSQPYLNREMRDFLLAHGGRMIHSSDSHSIDTIGKF